jgi:nucleoside-diphosphate kinase
MSKEKTLSIIKPNSTLDNNIGNIIAVFEKQGLRISAAKLAKLSKEKAEGFYIEHKERPFFGELVNFMTSGPVLLMVLEGDNAVAKNREIMGATNPANAAEGTIRKLFAKSVGENSVHGSDSLAAADREIAYFFEKNEIINRF